eukprot:XP_019930229.1 PREDICTED: uncharacterized protein LOC105347349 [Crassostrea gigas]
MSLPGWVKKAVEEGQDLSTCMEMWKHACAVEREERQARREKEKDELEMQRIKMENDEKERKRLHDKDLEEKRLEVRMKELELQEREMRERETNPVAMVEREAKHEVKFILPKYVEGEDIDVFLRSFERLATLHKWQKAEWALRLIPQLTGKALDTYARLGEVEANDYDVIKNAILKRYNLTASTYRDKFRGCKQFSSETFREFSSRATNYFDHWCQMEKVNKNHDNLVDVLMREQLTNSSSRDLQIWLKERQPKSVEEMIELAEAYQNAHKGNQVMNKGPVLQREVRNQGNGVKIVYTVINLDTYTLSEFTFRYQNPVPMSMELEQVIPTLEYNHYFKSVTIPKNVTFTILMKKFSKLPPGISVLWDFNDGTPLKHFELVSPTVTHTFSGKRGTYNMVIKMKNSDREYTFHKRITLGVIQLKSDTIQFDLMGRNTYITLEAKGISGNPSYLFDVDTNDSPPGSIQPFKVNPEMKGTRYKFSYKRYGFYIPSVFGICAGNETETVFLDEPLIADFSLKDVLSLNVQPIQIPLPTGAVDFSIVSSSGTTLPRVTCAIKPGDAVDRDSVFVKTQNISSKEPMIFKYVYTSLGANIVTINCSNYISDTTMEKTATTVNSCFDTGGIFDRQYSLPTNPMKVFSANDLYISNRMEIFCKDSIKFHWKLFQTNNTEEVGLPIEYENPFKEGQGRMLIRRNTLREGLIYLHLNVTLSTTWITEYMYIQFHRLHPFAYIVGGDHVIGLKDMTFDALAESRMDYHAFGENENFNFTWKCTRISPANMTVNEIRIDETPLEYCSVKELSRGIVQLSSVTSTDLDYAVTVTVHGGSLERTFTQIASITETGPTLIIKYIKIYLFKFTNYK